MAFANFGTVLRPWRYSKLATGKAIELLGRRTWRSFRAGPIEPSTLDEIAQVLEEGDTGGHRNH